MAVTITVLSQKGGTGKTTTVRTLADAYRRAGLEVLCVDLDPQGNLSDYFDVPADASPTIADVLAGQARAADAVHDDVLPANLGLAEAELVLAGKMGRELTLKRGLRDVKRGYDLVLIDCPPVARPADRERPGRGRPRADHERGGVLLAPGRRAGARGGRAGHASRSTRTWSGWAWC